MLTRRSAAAGAAAACINPNRHTAAQDTTGSSYPNRSVRLVVPFTPGGTSDILARLIGQKLTERFGQAFVVENRAGAQAIVGTDAVAKARPDGYTLVMGTSGSFVFNPATFDRLPYDAVKDFAPICQIASSPMMLLVTGDSLFRDVRELIFFAKANPDKVSYSAPGSGFQLTSELFNQKAGTRFLHVAYRGSADSINAVANGEVTMTFVDSGAAYGPLTSGRVRALAVTAPQRLSSLPATPTLPEYGFSDFQAGVWYGLLAPAGTPDTIIAGLSEATAAVTLAADTRARLMSMGIEPLGAGPEELRRIIAAEIPFWRDFAVTANIRLER